MTAIDPGITARASALREQINYHSYRYNVLSEPIITDAEYDALFNELKQLEAENPALITPDSPTQRTGNDLSDDFAKVTHPAPILSLANAYTDDDLRAWEDRNRKLLPENTVFDYTLEPKLDGLTIVLTYENGILTTAATRGNGEMGDDVTANVRTIDSVPLRIPVDPDSTLTPPERLVVRGEILFLLKDFEAINQERITNGENPFINPRNAASGTLKQKDSRITAKRPLTAYFYDVVELFGITLDTRWDILGYLRDSGFPIAPNIQHYPTLESVIDALPTWENQRNNLDFEIDGVVVKINGMRTYRELGIVGKDPRGAIAYKYPAQEATTALLDVTVGVGRTGRVVPTAVLEPVFVGGVTISNATLHNYDFVREHDIRIGDRVVIKRSGDVIPYVIGPVPGSRSGDEVEITPPKTCPFCDTAIIKPEGAVDYYCPNPDCPERVFRQIEFFVSRQAMDIEGLGTQTVRVLLDENLIRDEGDIFYLQAEQLLPLERFGQKKVENLMRSIEQVKSRPLTQVLTALGIEGVGGTVANLLIRDFTSLDALSQATPEQLVEIDGIGPVIAQAVADWFQVEHNQRVLDKMRRAGVRWQAEQSQQQSSKLDGLKFVLTGTLPTLTRDEATELIESHGGRVVGSVSKKTSYLVAGESAGSKLEKAQKLGIPVLSESDLNALINQSENEKHD